MTDAYIGGYCHCFNQEEFETIKEIQTEYSALIMFIKSIGKDFCTFAEDYAMEYFDEFNEQEIEILDQLLEKVYNKFYETFGLAICLGYHDSTNNGSNDDDIDGVYWEIINATKKTDEALAFEEKYGTLQERSWIIYG